jgi:3'-phosphoadenosine 5'-phosphosulfate sulfotransferase (PAPS reductase)/FAD synthetase
MKAISFDDPRLKGALIVASVSGGKDSAAMSLALTANGLEHRRVFADTGWEHPLTYEYLRGPLTKAIGSIDEVMGRDGGMVPLVRRKKMFPFRKIRFCTQELKVKPILAYIAPLAETNTVINAVGIRAGESAARAKLTEWEWSDSFDCWVWRPLLNWSEQDVISAHLEAGLPPNPLYMLGAQRVGCFPCIMSRKSEVRLMGEIWPERVAEIRALEKEIGDKAEEKVGGAEELARLGKHRPTFFMGTPVRSFPPIDDVIEWSKTTRGGRQFDLLPRDPQEGCMRWGLCDTASTDDDEENK